MAAAKLPVTPICHFSNINRTWHLPERCPVAPRPKRLVVSGSSTSSLQDDLLSSAPHHHYHLHHIPSSSVFLLADSVGHSLASYYTSLRLFVISVPGLWSLLKRSVKSKIVQKTFIGEGEGRKVPAQVAGEILSFFTNNNFAVLEKGDTITGLYYWTRASRKEQIKVKMMVGKDGTLSEIIVQGDDVQVEQMRKELQLTEKGMVYVKGIFES